MLKRTAKITKLPKKKRGATIIKSGTREMMLLDSVDIESIYIWQLEQNALLSQKLSNTESSPRRSK